MPRQALRGDIEVWSALQARLAVGVPDKAQRTIRDRGWVPGTNLRFADLIALRVGWELLRFTPPPREDQDPRQAQLLVTGRDTTALRMARDIAAEPGPHTYVVLSEFDARRVDQAEEIGAVISLNPSREALVLPVGTWSLELSALGRLT